MPTVLLLRHGRTTANASGVLAGWSPGVGLDETGQRQAEAVAARITAALRPVAVFTSPLQRCTQTAAALSALGAPSAQPVEELGEARYGSWTGRSLAELTSEPLWKSVQNQPSAVEFPPSPQFENETMTAMQARAVDAVRRLDRQVATEHGESAVWVVVSHGDIIKSVLADALGMHLDAFQRIVVGPASVGVIRYSRARPYVLRLNDVGGDLGDIVAEAASGDTDATPGGATGARPEDG